MARGTGHCAIGRQTRVHEQAFAQLNPGNRRSIVQWCLRRWSGPAGIIHKLDGAPRERTALENLANHLFVRFHTRTERQSVDVRVWREHDRLNFFDAAECGPHSCFAEASGLGPAEADMQFLDSRINGWTVVRLIAPKQIAMAEDG